MGRKKKASGRSKPAGRRRTRDLVALDLDDPELKKRVLQRCREEFRERFGRDWDPNLGKDTRRALEIEDDARKAYGELRRALVAALDAVLAAEKAAVDEQRKRMANIGWPQNPDRLVQWSRGRGIGDEAVRALSDWLARANLTAFDLDRSKGDMRRYARREIAAAEKELKAAEAALANSYTDPNVERRVAALNRMNDVRELRPFVARAERGWHWSMSPRARLVAFWGSWSGKDVFGTRRPLNPRELALVSLLQGNWLAPRRAGDQSYTVEDIIGSERRAMHKAQQDHRRKSEGLLADLRRPERAADEDTDAIFEECSTLLTGQTAATRSGGDATSVSASAPDKDADE